MPPNILLVEDTPDISLWLGTALRQGGMAVSFATDGLQAERCLQPGHGFDAVLLDLQLPGQDGLSVLQVLRERGDEVPVLILTARASVPDRVLGLNMGADDYLPKPFDLSELEARLQVLLRRRGRVKVDELRLGPLTMSRSHGVVVLHGQALSLTRRETAALRVLLESPQRTVSKEQLHEQVFEGEATELDAVEVLIYRLRKKLEASSAVSGASGVRVTTFRGMGYMLTLSPEGQA
ncbi:DNA-binding response regulator [Limnohabitans sp. T6-5]|nr:response regulator transcription factor [Limnohabitans sp. T6-5]PUE06196.1 DNA-binding response regulator [Limnohabitans sp. T6-5]